MDKYLNTYLDKVDRYLKSMPASERADIINEIKSEMAELEVRESLSPEQIVERLGGPRELAGAYLGKSIAQSTAFSFKRLCTVIAFYSFAGAGSLFVLPITSVLGIGLMFCGIVAPVAGLVKALGYLIGIEMPWISFQFGNYTAHPYLAFLLSVILGGLLLAAGIGLWKITIKFIQFVSQNKFQKKIIK